MKILNSDDGGTRQLLGATTGPAIGEQRSWCECCAERVGLAGARRLGTQRDDVKMQRGRPGGRRGECGDLARSLRPVSAATWSRQRSDSDRSLHHVGATTGATWSRPRTCLSFLRKDLRGADEGGCFFPPSESAH